MRTIKQCVLAHTAVLQGVKFLNNNGYFVHRARAYHASAAALLMFTKREVERLPIKKHQ